MLVDDNMEPSNQQQRASAIIGICLNPDGTPYQRLLGVLEFVGMSQLAVINGNNPQQIATHPSNPGLIISTQSTINKSNQCVTQNQVFQDNITSINESSPSILQALLQTPRTKSCQQTPQTMTCQQTPQTKSCQQTPQTKACQQTPQTKACQQTPQTIARQQAPQTKSCQQTPQTMKCQQTPQTMTCQQTPQRMTCQQTPQTKSFQQTPETKSCQSKRLKKRDNGVLMKLKCDCGPNCLKQFLISCLFCNFTCCSSTDLSAHLVHTHDLYGSERESIIQQATILPRPPPIENYTLECLFCHEEFTSILFLKQHVLGTHNVCNICSEVLQNNEPLHPHLKDQSSNQCAYCPFKSCKINDLIYHIKLHDFRTCISCDAQFSILNLTNKVVECTKCNDDQITCTKLPDLNEKQPKVDTSIYIKVPEPVLPVSEFKSGMVYKYCETCNEEFGAISNDIKECKRCLLIDYYKLHGKRIVFTQWCKSCDFNDQCLKCINTCKKVNEGNNLHENSNKLHPPDKNNSKLCTNKKKKASKKTKETLGNNSTNEVMEIDLTNNSMDPKNTSMETIATSPEIKANEGMQTKSINDKLVTNNELETNTTTTIDKTEEVIDESKNIDVLEIKRLLAKHPGISRNKISYKRMDICKRCTIVHETRIDQFICKSNCKLRCFICNTGKLTCSELVCHILKYHGYGASTCVKTMVSNYLQKVFVYKIKNSSKYLTCVLCNTKFLNESTFQNHIILVHQFCSYCSVHCSSMHNHLQHWLCPSFVCGECGQEFMYKAAFVQHFTAKHQEIDTLNCFFVNRRNVDGFSCPFCSFETTDYLILSYHLDLHRAKLCTLCGFKYVKFCFDEDTDRCSECSVCLPQSSITSQMLQRIPCIFCSYVCGNGIELHKHCRLLHPKNCLTCNLEFSTITKQREHKKCNHFDLYQCPLCLKKSFSIISALQHFNKTHLIIKSKQMFQRIKFSEDKIKNNSQCPYCLQNILPELLLIHLKEMHKIIQCIKCNFFTFSELNCSMCICIKCDTNSSFEYVEVDDNVMEPTTKPSPLEWIKGRIEPVNLSSSTSTVITQEIDKNSTEDDCIRIANVTTCSVSVFEQTPVVPNEYENTVMVPNEYEDTAMVSNKQILEDTVVVLNENNLTTMVPTKIKGSVKKRQMSAKNYEFEETQMVLPTENEHEEITSSNHKELLTSVTYCSIEEETQTRQLNEVLNLEPDDSNSNERREENLESNERNIVSGHYSIEIKQEPMEVTEYTYYFEEPCDVSIKEETLDECISEDLMDSNDLVTEYDMQDRTPQQSTTPRESNSTQTSECRLVAKSKWFGTSLLSIPNTSNNVQHGFDLFKKRNTNITTQILDNRIVKVTLDNSLNKLLKSTLEKGGSKKLETIVFYVRSKKTTKRKVRKVRRKRRSCRVQRSGSVNRRRRR